MASLAASHPPMQHGITVRGQRKSKNEIARFRALKRQNLAISEQAAAPKATLHQPLSLCSRATNNQECASRDRHLHAEQRMNSRAETCKIRAVRSHRF